MAWYVKPGEHAFAVPAIAHLQNAFIAALNEYPHLPKYIFMIPDKDVFESVIDDVKLIDNGIKKIHI